ncbi:hypothetical protein BT67DRAFT_381316 [Trichocladium antarcticum]|uniref:TOM core complex subunit Tom6 n=1 Tax=Trichocladium antarcticum TaxID=1450529 RepID=A0AAN6ZDK6_9PEZI|nr:hypothetical protein BT67DRAFT_381316 [Trichocladium antarcticum]
MPQPRIAGSGSSRRSMNPFTATYNAFVVSENAPIVRSITAFGFAVTFLATGWGEYLLSFVPPLPSFGPPRLLTSASPA